MSYLLTYDLNRPGQHYTELFSALQQAGAVRILLSTWVVPTNENSVTVRDHFWRYMDGNDRLFVCHVDSQWGSYNIMNREAALPLLP